MWLDVTTNDIVHSMSNNAVIIIKLIIQYVIYYTLQSMPHRLIKQSDVAWY